MVDANKCECCHGKVIHKELVEMIDDNGQEGWFCEQCARDFEEEGIERV